MDLVVMLIVAAWIYRRWYRRRMCRIHGHVWENRGKRLRCRRCRRKSHSLTIIKPM